MKTFFAATVSFFSIPAFAVGGFTSSLDVSCSGSFKILETKNPFFTKSHCPGGGSIWSNGTCGRANPVPASAGFTAKVKIDLKGCELLKTKYGYPLTQIVEQKIYLGKAFHNPAIAAQLSAGEFGHLEVSQSYAHNDNGYLPFFPIIHSESFSLSGTIQLNSKMNVEFSTGFEVDTKKVYGIEPLSNISKADMTALLNEIEQEMNLAYTPNSKEFFKYSNLLSNLNSKKVGLEKEHAALIVKLFQNVGSQQYPPSFYFSFNVGGSGGTDLAHKLNGISQSPEVLSHQEKVNLLSTYPTLLNISFAKDNCFALDEAILEQSLSNILEQIQQKKLPNKTIGSYELKNIAAILSAKQYNPCSYPNNETVLSLAQQIIHALGPQ